MIMPQEMPQDLSDRAVRVAPASQTVGLVFCLAGVFVLGYAATEGPGAHSLVGYSGIALIAVGWALFGYVIYRRTRYARVHPFKG